MDGKVLYRHPVIRYGFAVGGVVVFTVLKLYVEGGEKPFLLMRIPVLVTAFWMGLGPAIVSLLLSALAVDYFFLAPIRSFALSGSSMYSETIFILETSILLGLIILLRRALDRASSRAEELARTESRLRIALTGSNISIFTCDRNLRITWAYNSPPGFEESAIIGKTPLEVLPGQEATALEGAMRQVLDTGAGARIQLAPTLHGTRRQFELIIEPQRYKEQSSGVVCACTDVTERSRYEEGLRLQEAKFQNLADSMPQIIWSAEPDGRINYWNRRWYEFTGFTEQQRDESWLPVVHPDDVQPALQAWRHCVESGEPLEMECRLRDLHLGEFRWYLIRAIPVRDTNGIIVKWYGSFTNFHDYRAALDALRKSEERFRSLVTATAQIVWSTNAEGKVEDIPEWRELTGQSVEEVKGYGWLDAIHPGDRERILLNWEAARTTTLFYSADYRIRLKDGSYRWYSARAVPVRDSDGTVREWVGLCVDIEEERRAEEQMQHAAEAMAVARDAAVQANRAKSSFLANISHELRTPLNAILGYAEILAEDLRPTGQDQMMADVERISSAGNHLLNVVNDLLDLSKIEAGRMTLQVRSVAVDELLDEVISTIQPVAEQSGNRLEYKPSDIGSIQTDSDKLRQILMNLLSNACKFTVQGEVSLRCWREGAEAEGGQVCFAVSDTGIGIAADDLPRLFHDFTQLDPSFTRRFGGTGLGLAISQRFALLLGGSIAIDSELGHGSTFTLRIPTRMNGSADSAVVELQRGSV